MRRRYGRKRRSAEILSQNFQNDDDDDKMMKMSSQQKRRRDARLRVTNMMMERWRNDESRKTVRIFYSAFTLTFLQQIKHSYYIYVYLYLSSISCYSLTNSHAHSSNDAHLRNARSTGSCRPGRIRWR